MEKIYQKWKDLKGWQQFSMVLAVVLLFAFWLIGTSQEEPNLLYSNLEPSESREVQSELARMGIGYTTEDEGARIYVETDDTAHIEAEMSAQGLPYSGEAGLEIFNEGSVGSTQYEKERQYENAVVNEVQRGLIRGFDFVDNAVVQLNFSSRQSIFDDLNDASAAVTVRTVRGEELNPNQVDAVRHFVAARIANLSAEEVDVMDRDGKIYSGGQDEASHSEGFSRQMEIVSETEQRIREDIMRTLNVNFGEENVTVTVRADINFDEIVQNIESYDPEGTLVSRQESSDSVERTSEDMMVAPGTDANADVPEYNMQEGTGNEYFSQETEEIVENFEVGKTVETIQKNPELRNIMVTATINHNMEEEIREEFIGRWERIIANEAGIVIEEGEENGTVVVETTNFVADNQEDPFDIPPLPQEEAEEDYLAMAVWFALAGVVLLIFAIVMIVSARKRKKLEVIIKEEKERNEKTAKERENQEAMKHDLEEEVEEVEEERYGGFDASELTSNQKLTANHVKDRAKEDPKRTANFLKQKVDEE